MADFQLVLSKTLTNEGGFFFNKDTGEIVNRGITIATLIAHGLLPPDILAAYQAYKADGNYGHLDPVIAYMKSRTVADDTHLYLLYYWKPIYGDQILSQAIAEKLFDLDVNQGGAAVMELQQAINDLQLGAPALDVDGKMGPATLTALNQLPESKLLPAFQARAEARYRAIAVKNPALAGNLQGWLDRLYRA